MLLNGTYFTGSCRSVTQCHLSLPVEISLRGTHFTGTRRYSSMALTSLHSYIHIQKTTSAQKTASKLFSLLIVSKMSVLRVLGYFILFICEFIVPLFFYGSSLVSIHANLALKPGINVSR